MTTLCSVTSSNQLTFLDINLLNSKNKVLDKTVITVIAQVTEHVLGVSTGVTAAVSQGSGWAAPAPWGFLKANIPLWLVYDVQ